MSASTSHSLINCQSANATLATRVATLAGSVVDTLRLWYARSSQRRAFPLLSERDLHDMRLSRWDLESELRKPFWRG